MGTDGIEPSERSLSASVAHEAIHDQIFRSNLIRSREALGEPTGLVMCTSPGAYVCTRWLVVPGSSVPWSPAECPVVPGTCRVVPHRVSRSPRGGVS